MNNWIIIAIMAAGLLLMVAALVILARLSKMKDAELRNGSKMELLGDVLPKKSEYTIQSWQ